MERDLKLTPVEADLLKTLLEETWREPPDWAADLLKKIIANQSEASRQLAQAAERIAFMIMERWPGGMPTRAVWNLQDFRKRTADERKAILSILKVDFNIVEKVERLPSGRNGRVLIKRGQPGLSNFGDTPNAETTNGRVPIKRGSLK